MNKRYISTRLRERIGMVGGRDGYFIRNDYDYVAQGVALEYVPGGIYIWSFVFPLFDFFGPHLSYSNRLSRRPFIARGEMTDEAVVDHIVTSPELRNVLAAESAMSLSEFVRFLEGRGLTSIHARLNHAAALVLLGQDAMALTLLNNLSSVLNSEDLISCDLLRNGIGDAPGVAKQALDEVRQKNIKELTSA